MRQGSSRDPFHTVGSFASAVLFAAGAAAMIGCFMTWVVFRIPDQGSNQVAGQRASAGISGLHVTPDSTIVLVAGVLVLVVAGTLAWRRRGAGLALLASIVIGAVGIADYRGVERVLSVAEETGKTIGRAEPGAGVVLVAAAGIVGLFASIAGVAATPRSMERA